MSALSRRLLIAFFLLGNAVRVVLPLGAQSIRPTPGVAPGGADAVAAIRLATPVVEAPITTPGGRAVVAVMINGQGPFRLGIETGMPGLAIFPSAAQKLKLNDAVFVPAEKPLDSLQIGGLTLQGVQYVVAPPIFPSLLDGFLGLSAYAKLLMTIDYTAQQVRFERGALRADDAGVLPLIAAGPLWSVEVGVGNRSTTLLFDTQGGAMGVMLWSDMTAAIALKSAPVTVGYAQSPAFGVVPKRVARLADSVRIGPFRIPEPMISLQDGRREIGDGILGIDFISQFTVTLDQANRRVRFASPTRVLPRASSMVGRGIAVAYSLGPVKVIGVVPDAPGAKADIQLGDIIAQVDGRSTTGFAPADWDAVNSTRADVTMVIERGATRRTVKVPSTVFVP